MRLASLFAVTMLLVAGTVAAFERDPSRDRVLDSRVMDAKPAAAAGALVRAMAREEIVWHPDAAVPVAIAGRISKADPLERLRRLLPAGIELVKRDGRRFGYVFGGKTIYPGVLTYTKGRSTFLLAGSFVLDARVLNHRRLGGERAKALALAYLRVARAARPVRSEEIFFDTRRGLAHAHLVTVQTRTPPGDFRVVVDASDGRVLYCNDMVAAVDGFAGVYLNSPLRSGITVEPISNIERSGRLEGKYIAVENEDTPTQASDQNNRFVYPPSNKHLDEANAYYHADRMHSFFKEKYGFSELDSPMAVGVYYGENLDNAYYVPWGNYIVLGDGGRYNVLSRDASVIYHEYTHAVTSKIAALGVGGEAAALNEGFSDYFAASVLDDPRVGEWTVAKVGRPYMRTCENSKRYPADLVNESHQDGSIWAGALWDLRKSLGRETADALAHWARYSLNSESTMLVAARALVQADEDKFAGAHREAIESVLAARGLVSNDTPFRRALRLSPR